MAMVPLSSERVEGGTSDVDTWMYTKYSDGLLICTMRHRFTCAINIVTKDIYHSNILQLFEWPMDFTKIYSVSVDTVSPSNFCWVCYHEEVTLTRPGCIDLASSTSKAIGPYDVCVTGIGRWD